jgi:hypothetical protein
METNKIIAGLIVGGLLVGGAVYYSDTKDSSVNNETKIIETMKEGFIDGCISEDATYSYCSCSYDKLMDAWGVDKFVTVSIQYEETGELPDGTINLISQCLDLI